MFSYYAFQETVCNREDHNSGEKVQFRAKYYFIFALAPRGDNVPEIILIL